MSRYIDLDDDRVVFCGNDGDYGRYNIPEDLQTAQPDLSEHSTWFCIGETLVDESKMHITAEQAVDKIRGYMIRMKKPERKKGKWIKGGEQPYFRKHFDIVVCSICNKRGEHRWNYCPNCGADMRGEENG